MDNVVENSTDAAQAKHVPVLEKVENGYKVTVGEVEHPMTEEHYINWIELIADKEVYRAELKPTDKPIAYFCLDKPNVTARAYCNLHGLWSKES
jgi:superoxide reductase